MIEAFFVINLEGLIIGCYLFKIISFPYFKFTYIINACGLIYDLVFFLHGIKNLNGSEGGGSCL